VTGWLDAAVPGTAAGALRAAGLWQHGDDRDFDAEDWWFRTTFQAAAAQPGEQLLLCLDGLATVCDVYLNGKLLLANESMFAAHAVDIGALLTANNELAIRCHALAPLLAVQRRPRARWRTRVVADGTLRFFRTMLMGRAPGFAPAPAAVGPWRPVYLHRRRSLAVDALQCTVRLDGDTGVVSVNAAVRALGAAHVQSARVELRGPTGQTHGALLSVSEDAGTQPPSDSAAASSIGLQGNLRVANVARWWPHTHGQPALYEMTLHLDGPSGPLQIDAGRVGFRELAFGPTADHDVVADGLALQINGQAVFARGAVWTPLDLPGLTADATQLREALVQARDAGANILRIPGTAAYEQAAFHDLCDELGILVWQDFMFANMDYPIAEPSFAETVRAEARQQLTELAGRPSLAVLCGNSEVFQQVAMLGLDPALARGELFDELLPEAVRASGADAIYVPSAPCGGELPFRTNAGVAHYFGVGGYRRPLQDARCAEVRFAAECLAFSNVPDADTLTAWLGTKTANAMLADPRWKAGIPHDVGADWDFEDVRNHYLGLMFGLDPDHLRSADPERYVELSRLVTGEVMAEVFGEWRRTGSPCAGAVMLWLRDLMPGAGWGIVDHLGRPKAAYYHLRRAWWPIAVWTTDEGLNGIVAHVANDLADPVAVHLRVALYRDQHQLVEESEEHVELAAHGSYTRNLESLLGHFVDISHSYRFGPPGHDLVVVSVEGGDGDGERKLVSQAVRFGVERPTAVQSATELGLRVTAVSRDDGAMVATVHCDRLAYGVRVELPGYLANENWFCVEPGHERSVILSPAATDTPAAPGTLTAANLRGELTIVPTFLQETV
jgi:beta-mannosidase